MVASLAGREREQENTCNGMIFLFLDGAIFTF